MGWAEEDVVSRSLVAEVSGYRIASRKSTCSNPDSFAGDAGSVRKVIEL